MTDINKTPDEDDSAAKVAAIGGPVLILLAVLIYSAPVLFRLFMDWLTR